MNWKAWLYSLVYSVVGGAANSAAAMLVAPDTFNFNDLPRLGKLLAAGALVSLVLYLKQSPLPARAGVRLASLKAPLVLALGLGLSAGCATWEGLSPGTQAVLKSAARLALSYGVDELSGRVKEVRPYQHQLRALIETTFARPVEAEQAGAALRAGVLAIIPEDLREVVLAQFRESLAGDRTTAASTGVSVDYNRRVASRL